jgi:hypothetical protein
MMCGGFIILKNTFDFLEAVLVRQLEIRYSAMPSINYTNHSYLFSETEFTQLSFAIGVDQLL